jgi:hypothetical protein
VGFHCRNEQKRCALGRPRSVVIPRASRAQFCGEGEIRVRVFLEMVNSAGLRNRKQFLANSHRLFPPPSPVFPASPCEADTFVTQSVKQCLPSDSNIPRDIRSVKPSFFPFFDFALYEEWPLRGPVFNASSTSGIKQRGLPPTFSDGMVPSEVPLRIVFSLNRRYSVTCCAFMISGRHISGELHRYKFHTMHRQDVLLEF